jgi:hypothetical protein
MALKVVMVALANGFTLLRAATCFAALNPAQNNSGKPL